MSCKVILVQFPMLSVIFNILSTIVSTTIRICCIIIDFKTILVHMFFDDAMAPDPQTKELMPNSYVRDFMKCVNSAGR